MSYDDDSSYKNTLNNDWTLKCSMCLVISLFCLFYFHVKSLNFIFYVFVKSIVHQSYDQSIGCIYTSVNLKENQLNWVDELLTVEIKITITFDTFEIKL